MACGYQMALQGFERDLARFSGMWDPPKTRAQDDAGRDHERAAELAARERRSIEEEPRFRALMNECGRDAVLAALRDVQQIRLETFERVFGKVRGKPSQSDQ
jgi:hypothetical protein